MNPYLRFIALLPCLLPTSLPAQEPRGEHLLQMAFQPGSVQFHRKTVTVEKRSEDGAARSNVLEVTIETSVTAAAEGKVSLQQTVVRVATRATAGGANDYDSETGGKDPGVGLMVGKTFRMKVDASGATTDFTVPDGLPTGRIDPWFIPVLQLPATPVGIGKTWEAKGTMSIPELRNTDVVLVHKLSAVDKGKATIATEVKLDKDKGVPASMTIEKNAGSAVIDLATGKLLESRSELALSASRGEGRKSVTTMTTSVQPIDPPKPAKSEPKGGED